MRILNVYSPDVRANIRDLTWATLPAHCKRMATQALIRSIKQGAFRKRPAAHRGIQLVFRSEPPCNLRLITSLLCRANTSELCRANTSQ